jgi:hypothetical protein
MPLTTKALNTFLKDSFFRSESCTQDDWEMPVFQKRLASFLTAKQKNLNPKDPNKPTKPCNSYQLFSKDVRSSIVSEHPEFKSTQVMKEIGRLWGEFNSDPGNSSKSLSYKEQADKLKEQYNQAIDNYVPTPGFECTKKAKKSGVKGAKSAYMHFADTVRGDVLERNPGLKTTDVAKEIGSMWRETYRDDPERRAEFDRLSDEDKERYRREKSVESEEGVVESQSKKEVKAKAIKEPSQPKAKKESKPKESKPKESKPKESKPKVKKESVTPSPFNASVESILEQVLGGVPDDADAPGPFQLYCLDRRGQLHSERPDLSKRKITDFLREEYRSLPAAVKNSYKSRGVSA